MEQSKIKSRRVKQSLLHMEASVYYTSESVISDCIIPRYQTQELQKVHLIDKGRISFLRYFDLLIRDPKTS